MDFSEYKRLRCSSIPSKMTGMISDDAMSLEFLHQLFESTNHRALISESDPENRHLLIAGDKIPIVVRVDNSPERRFVVFSAHRRYIEETEFSDKVLHIMELNADKLLVRHSLINNDTLYFDYALSFEDGILPQTILNSYFRFNFVISNTLRDGAQDNETARVLGHKAMFDLSWK